MAIQLARAIGEQRKPISPLEGLSDIIAKTGEGIQKKQEAEQAKTQREQAMKDAIFSKINISPPEGLPQQKAEYEAFVNKNLPSLIYDRVSGKISSQEFDKRVSDFQYQLDRRKIKYKKDYKDFEDASAAQVDYDTTDFDNFLTGTPDREEIIEPETTMNAPYKEKSMMDVEPETKEAIAQPEKKIIKGQQGYFNLPFEEQEKYDLRSKLDETKVPRSVGTLKAMQSLSPNFKPESLIGIHKDEKGVVTAYKDEDAIKRIKAEYIISMVSPENHGKEHAIERKAIMNTVMKKMEDDKVPNEERSGRMPEYIAVVAGKSFDKLVENTYEFESRKTNEARLLKEGSGSRSGEKSDKTKIEKLEGSVTVPAFEQLRLDKIAEQQAKIDEYTQNIKKYKRKADEYESSGDRASAERERRLAAGAQKVITETEKIKSLLEKHEPNIKDVYIFSSQEEKVDAVLNFSGEGKTTVKMQPTGIFKMNGVTYIGGISPKDGKDIYVPYNQNNKAVLGVNKGKLLEKIQEKGFKTPEELDAEKQKKGSAKPATQKTWAERQAEKKKNK